MGDVVKIMRKFGASQQAQQTSAGAEAQPPAAGAQEPQPPGRAQLAEDITAAAQTLRAATSQLVAVAPAGEQTARLLGTYNSLLSTLQTLRERLEGATDADLLDIGRDVHSAVTAAQDYLTEAGKLVGSTSAALAPAGRVWPRWVLVLSFLAGVGVVAGGGYYFWKKSKRRGVKLGRPPKSKSKTDD